MLIILRQVAELANQSGFKQLIEQLINLHLIESNLWVVSISPEVLFLRMLHFSGCSISPDLKGKIKVRRNRTSREMEYTEAKVENQDVIRTSQE